MSTCNFETMRLFPLYVKEDEAFYRHVCPECDALMYEECGKWYCPCCDHEEENPTTEAVFDDDECMYWYDDAQPMLKAFNDTLRFFSVSLQSGYYCDCQLRVRPAQTSNSTSRHDDCEEWNPRNLDNYECNYYFDMCRSRAIRAYDAEVRKVNRFLKKAANDLGMVQLACVGVFSNGEAVYTRV